MQENNTLPSHGNTFTGQSKSKAKAVVQRRSLAALLMTAVLIGVVALIASSPAAMSDVTTAPRLEGTWRTTVTITGGPPSFSELNSFNGGGTVSEVDETQLSVPSGGPGVGVWTKVGGSNQYAFTWESYLFDFSVTGIPPIGKLQIRGLVTLIDRNTYTAVDQFQFYDVNGNPTFGGCATEAATRMTVLPVTSCPDSSQSGTSPDRGSKPARGWKSLFDLIQ